MTQTPDSHLSRYKLHILYQVPNTTLKSDSGGKYIFGLVPNIMARVSTGIRSATNSTETANQID